MAEQLDLLGGIKDDLKNESRAAQDVGLSEMAFAIYGVLDDDGGPPRPGAYDEGRKNLASKVEETLEPYVTMVDWAMKEDLQRKIRRDVKRVLREAGLPEDTIQQQSLSLLDLATPCHRHKYQRTNNKAQATTVVFHDDPLPEVHC